LIFEWKIIATSDTFRVILASVFLKVINTYTHTWEKENKFVLGLVPLTDHKFRSLVLWIANTQWAGFILARVVCVKNERYR